MDGKPLALVLGGSGFVGRNVCAALAKRYIAHEVASRSTGADLRNTDEVAALLTAVKPTVIVNCAAHVGSLNYVSEQAADVISDNARMSLAIADHAYVLDNGAIVYSGTAEALAGDDARVQALAGASAEEWSVSNLNNARR